MTEDAGRRIRLVIILVSGGLLIATVLGSVSFINHGADRRMSLARSLASGKRVDVQSILSNPLSGAGLFEQAGIKVDSEMLTQSPTGFCVEWGFRYYGSLRTLRFSVDKSNNILTPVKTC